MWEENGKTKLVYIDIKTTSWLQENKRIVKYKNKYVYGVYSKGMKEFT